LQAFQYLEYKEEWYMENEIIEKNFWRAYGQINSIGGEAEICIAWLS